MEEEEEEEEEDDSPPGLIDEDSDDEGFFFTKFSNSTPSTTAAPAPLQQPKIDVSYLGGEGRKGRKYYLSGLVKNKIFSQAMDTAADISIMGENLADRYGLNKFHLDRPFTCEGFQSSSSSAVKITHFCCVDVDLGGAVLPVKFYVAPIDGKFALLGTDVLGDPASGLSFETSSGIVKYKGQLFYTKKSVDASTVEFRRRERMGATTYRRNNSSVNAAAKMRVSRRVTLPPRSVTWIDAFISGGDFSKLHSFLSYYAEDESLISIPNLTFHRRRYRYRIPVTNETSSSFTFRAGAVLGDVIQHRKEEAMEEADGESTASVFNIMAGRDLSINWCVKDGPFEGIAREIIDGEIDPELP